MNLSRMGGGRGGRTRACLVLLALLGGCATNPSEWMHGGETLMSVYRTPAHEVDYKVADLPAPPMGFRWYHVDRQYVLANRTTGLILKSAPAPATPPMTAGQP